jgi:hypothetical protein
VENLALQHQLVVLRCSVKRPKLITADRLLWAWLPQVCALVGAGLQEGVAGFGDSAPEAHADLLERIRSDGDTTIWVPKAA